MTAVMRRSSAAVARSRRGLSAVAMAACIADVASHVDTAGARVVCIDFMHGVVTEQTDGAGFLALIDHLALTPDAPEGGVDRNIYADGNVGVLEQPVHVFAGLVDTLAAGLRAPS